MILTEEVKQFAKEVAQEQWEHFNSYHIYKSLEMPEIKFEDFADDAIKYTIKKRGLVEA